VKFSKSTFVLATALALALTGVLTAARLGRADANQTAAPEVTTESLLREMTDRDALARWPEPAFRAAQASSYDRRSTAPDADGWFANNDYSQFIRAEDHAGRREWVMMETDGPGAVTRFWMGMSTPQLPATGTLRFYLDGADRPAIEERAETLLTGRSFAPPPLAEVTARGRNFFFPIPFARGCKITYDRPPNWETMNPADNTWYVIEYRRYEAGTAVRSFSADQLAALRPAIERTAAVLSGAADEPVASPPMEFIYEGTGQRLDFTGPGAVRTLAIKVDPKKPEQWAPLKLVLHFDGPATVDVPLAALFGLSHGFRPFRDWYREVRADGTLILRLVMPFEHDGHLCLLDTSRVHSAAGFAVTVGPWEWDARSLRLHALWRRQELTTTAAGQDWTMAEVAGRGVYVGDALAVENCGLGWWGEGDEKIWVDGGSFPTHFGTGSEDYYGYSFGDRGRFFASPFHAMPRDTGNSRRGWVSLTRDRMLDRIPFTTSLRHDLEVLRGRECAETYEAVGIWYGGEIKK